MVFLPTYTSVQGERRSGSKIKFQLTLIRGGQYRWQGCLGPPRLFLGLKPISILGDTYKYKGSPEPKGTDLVYCVWCNILGAGTCIVTYPGSWAMYELETIIVLDWVSISLLLSCSLVDSKLWFRVLSNSFCIHLHIMWVVPMIRCSKLLILLYRISAGRCSKHPGLYT